VAAAAVAGGTVTYDQLRAISAATRHLSDEQSAEAAALLTDLAPAVDTRQLRSAARYLAHVVDPDRGAARFERQFDDRRATFAPLLDGSWRMEVHAEPEGAAVLDAALTRWMVPTDAGDLRTASQRRYDALVRIARTALDAGPTGLVGSSGPHLLVTCTPESLARAWRAGAVDSAAPAALRDGTPLPPPALARIACDAAITRVVFDPAGRVLDLGRTQRLFSPGQRLALWARDRGCRFPGCGAPWGHAHHTHPWSQGGRTDLADGVVLCGRHHRAVHEEAWRIEVGGGALGSHGGVTFVGPRGQRLTSRPPDPLWPLAPRALAPP
jgi:hypothetical protein